MVDRLFWRRSCLIMGIGWYPLDGWMDGNDCMKYNSRRGWFSIHSSTAPDHDVKTTLCACKSQADKLGSDRGGRCARISFICDVGCTQGLSLFTLSLCNVDHDLYFVLTRMPRSMQTAAFLPISNSSHLFLFTPFCSHQLQSLL